MPKGRRESFQAAIQAFFQTSTASRKQRESVVEKLPEIFNRLHTLMQRLRQLPRWPKRIILISHDIVLMLFALWLGMSLRLNVFYIPEPDLIIQFLTAPVLGVIIYHYLGLYKLVTRYINQRYMLKIAGATTLSVFAWALLLIMLQPERFVPRSVIIMYWLFTILFILSSRLVASWLLRERPLAVNPKGQIKKNVLIYGVGDAGFQLLESLRQGSDYFPVAFVDRDKSIWGQKIFNLKVYSPDKISSLIRNKDVQEIFLSLQSLSRSEKEEIIGYLHQFPVTVKKLPDIRDIESGKVQVSDLRPIKVEDLLSRDIVPPDKKLLSRNNRGRAVLVSGAGGSIGSEISVQVLHERPATLVLMELSEVALYKIDARIHDLEQEIEQETRQLPANESVPTYQPVKIVSILGSVLDEKLVRKVLTRYKIETIYHAAAYKHVPLVEMNPVAGLTNNVFGTRTLARIAMEEKVRHFVLISTDKAVRPTNIMGASKRLAEMILQAFSAEKQNQTVFAIVRFGNVLASSGSVVKKFTQQIVAGGPVTVTHPDIIRYFMCIPEAAQLVIQAGAMSQGGEIFVLDMGKPVKILELARTMIYLAGLNIRDKDHLEGDIEIVFTGLRPGEKLYEELLIHDNTSQTEHPRILKNAEEFIEKQELEQELAQLQEAMENNDMTMIREILKRTVEGYVCKQDEPLENMPVSS